VTTTVVSNVEAIQIVGGEALDPIHVFWVNSGPGQGYATVICYGSAWTVYFGGMGDRTIQQFFAEADTEYLVGKLHSPILKEGKKYDAYLTRIVCAIKTAIAVPVAA
jgi:hypothetical protein